MVLSCLAKVDMVFSQRVGSAFKVGSSVYPSQFTLSMVSSVHMDDIIVRHAKKNPKREPSGVGDTLR